VRGQFQAMPLTTNLITAVITEISIRCMKMPKKLFESRLMKVRSVKAVLRKLRVILNFASKQAIFFSPCVI
jgi:hypothetical protein